MVIVSHPTGNTFVRAVLDGLARDGTWEYEFHTTIGAPASGEGKRVWSPFIEKIRSRRSYPIPGAKLYQHPAREMVRLAAARLGLAKLVEHEAGWASVDRVYQALDAAVARRINRLRRVATAYAYEDGAKETFVAARAHGARTIYNLPIAHWETSKRLLEEEAERHPQWEPTLGATRDSAAKCQRKSEELELADVVICPSDFVYRSLPESIRERKDCVVLPFGSPVVMAPPEMPPTLPPRPLRVLFAGSMTQRKGLADVFAAFALLSRKDVELVILGTAVAGLEFYREQYPHFRYEPPRRHDEVLELMKTCDLLVLPSIVEGRALVQQEAMSCGLPLLATANAGGEDLIEEGITGFLVPIRNPQAIADRISWLADHRSALPEMKRAAVLKASTLTWSHYWEAHRGLFTRPSVRQVR